MRYLDYNALAPLCAAARAAWLEVMDGPAGNPSSPHRLGARADRVLEQAREAVAARLGCPAGAVVWTSGATEAANSVFHHLAQETDGEAWISAVEHPCVRSAARRWFAGRYHTIPVTPRGEVEVEWVRDALRRGRPAVVAVMAANNETGVCQPWREVLGLCRDNEVPFLCDAAQWLGKLSAAGLGDCDYVIGCAHKFGGTPGVGLLKCTSGFRSFIVGGPQEDGRRAGTENVAGAAACAAALADREAALQQEIPDARAAIRDAFEAEVRRRLPGTEVVGHGASRLWNTSALLLPLVDCRRRWVVRLDKRGFAVSTGSACSSGQERPSEVLSAMGLDARGERMIRVSGGWETPAEDWQALAEAMAGIGQEGSSSGDEFAPGR